MTVKTFCDMFESDLNEKVISRSINRSCDVAHDFIEKVMKVKVRHASIQTNSIDEIFADHVKQIEEQTAMLKAAKIHETSILGELNRITKRLKKSEKE